MSITSESKPRLDLTAMELSQRLAAKEVSSAEVLASHIARIEQVDGSVNALVQPMFDSARAAAEAADARRSAGESLGPLDGVPVSIKDCFDVRGAETTLGIPGYSKGVASVDSPLVARLLAAGAVVLGKTNVPQAMLLHECDNPVFGRTVHPLDPDRSPGGSTGGEPALVAAGGSPLGLGSDLGGSIRQPAAACGVFGFKPSTGRLTLVGSQRAISQGMQAIAIQPGPIARSVADLDLAMQIMTNVRGVGRQADESGGPWPHYAQIDVSQLRIGYWVDDGVFSPAMGVGRVVHEAADHLRKAGAEVVPVTPPDTMEMMRIYLGLISADGMASVRRLTHGKKVDPQLARQSRLARLPRWLRAGLAPLMPWLGHAELGDLLRWTGLRSVDAYWQLAIEANSYRRRFWREIDAQAGGPVDVLLSPPYGLPALRHGTALHLLTAASHTFLANLLDAPAGVVPVGHVTQADEDAERAERGKAGNGLTSRFARQNAEASTGLPLAVELMGRRGEDDKTVAAMAAVERAIG